MKGAWKADAGKMDTPMRKALKENPDCLRIANERSGKDVAETVDFMPAY